MHAEYSPLVPDGPRTRSYSRRLRSRPRGGQTEDGFVCKHCHAYVSAAACLSGVQNRNHCPYCLWSRHLDLYAAGDRLAACKAPMQPIGLSVKATHKKYGPGRGELMLIHQCTECGALSINRIAADDDPQKLWAVFVDSLVLDELRLEANGIQRLAAADSETVRAQLFGWQPDPTETLFQTSMIELA